MWLVYLSRYTRTYENHKNGPFMGILWVTLCTLHRSPVLRETRCLTFIKVLPAAVVKPPGMMQKRFMNFMSCADGKWEISMELVGGDSDLGIPSRALTYPTWGSSEHHLQICRASSRGIPVNFLEGNRFFTSMF